MGFIIGFLCGVIATLLLTPLLFKWWINKKVNILTGGLFK